MDDGVALTLIKVVRKLFQKAACSEVAKITMDLSVNRLERAAASFEPFPNPLEDRSLFEFEAAVRSLEYETAE